MKLVVSALLDYSRTVTLSGRDTATLLLNGEQLKHLPLKLGLPDLTPGTHCLLVAIQEDRRDLVGRNLPAHTSAGIMFLEVTKSTPDHCAARRLAHAIATRFTDPATHFGCGSSFFSVAEDRIQLRRTSSHGTPLNLFVPRCGTQVTLAFTKDGALLGPDGPIPPQVVGPEGRSMKEPRYIRFSSLEPGWWNVVTIAEGLAGDPRPVAARIDEGILVTQHGA